MAKPKPQTLRDIFARIASAGVPADARPRSRQVIAAKLGITRQALSAIISGRARLTDEMAISVALMAAVPTEDVVAAAKHSRMLAAKRALREVAES